jgi:hypothetical protein
MDNSQIDELKNKIIDLSIQCISDLKTQNTPYNSFHFELQKLLAEKSILFNLSSRREYPTVLPDEKYGFMDLVWFDEQKPIAAFEIDSRFYISSIWKLLSINADLRFWIYYNHMTEDELFLFRGKNKDKFVTLVKFPVVFDIKPEEERKIEKFYKRWKVYHKKVKPIKNTRIEETRITEPSHFDKIRQTHQKAYTKWTIQDDEKLKELFLYGKNVEEIAQILERNEGGINSRLKKLNLIDIDEIFFE